MGGKGNAVFAATSAWPVSRKQGIMTESHLLTCYPPAEIKSDAVSGGTNLSAVAPAEGPRRPVWGEKDPLALW